MIDERMEEQASLYVLGTLDAEETRAFETLLRRDPELQRLVAALRSAADAVAGDAPLVAPPPSLKQKILAEIDRRQKIVPLNPASCPPPPIPWFPWALAACLAVLCGILLIRQSNRENDFNAQLTQMNQTIATLQATTNDLHTVVAELKRQNDLANLRIAVLDSLVPDSKAVAVTLWDPDRQGGMLVVQKLGELPPDKDYQLWVIDPNAASPIDAGVFKVDASGTMRTPFTAKSVVKAAGKFAVTVERKGGSPKPQGKMVLLGS
jgi:anti-sigma-K factor RskA